MQVVDDFFCECEIDRHWPRGPATKNRLSDAAEAQATRSTEAPSPLSGRGTVMGIAGSRRRLFGLQWRHGVPALCGR
jgi:hypothetical protein